MADHLKFVTECIGNQGNECPTNFSFLIWRKEDLCIRLHEEQFLNLPLLCLILLILEIKRR